ARAWFEGRGQLETLPRPPGSAKRQEVHRWLSLLELCLERQWWLVGSRNRTEDAFGTYSIASRVASFLPLGGLWKSEVMELCQQIGVPPEVTASSRRADPGCGRPTELAEIALELIDEYLRVKLGEAPVQTLARFSDAQLRYLESLYEQNRF